MKKYKKTFKDYYNISEDENFLCENCGAVAVDIHHIVFKSHCGTDNINNLIALCRNCHIKAHNNKQFNNELKEKKDNEFKHKK